MKTDITQITLTLIDVVPWAAIAAVAVKWWRQSRFSRFIPVARTAVQAAEQILSHGTGSDKRTWVSNYLSKQLKGKLTQDEIDKLIESAVLEMNTLLKPPSAENTKSSDSVPAAGQPLITEELIDEIAKETAANLAKKLNAV
ncbi:MAG TPA: phage holin, LLH family [Clostridia bacterium]